MRYVTYEARGRARLGALVGDALIDVHTASEGTLPASMLEFVAAGEAAWERGRALLEAGPEGLPAGAVVDRTAARLLAPIPRPAKNVFAVGRNYAAHVREGAAARQEEADLPTVPVFFTKAPTSVIGPDALIPWAPEVTEQLDWEAELAVVIGRGGADIPRERALQHVFGYTVANDVSARDLQFRHGQWFKGKTLDGTCPLGPAVVTPDEIDDLAALEIECRVNGVMKQKASTAQMIFPIDEIIAVLSAGMTLEPGDVILTGTPEGVGFARKPPEFLSPGDVVECEVAGVGLLRNQVGTSTGGNDDR